MEIGVIRLFWHGHFCPRADLDSILIACTGLKAAVNQCPLRVVVIVIIRELDTILTAK